MKSEQRVARSSKAWRLKPSQAPDGSFRRTGNEMTLLHWMLMPCSGASRQ